MNLTTAWVKSYVRYPYDMRRATGYLRTRGASAEHDKLNRPIVVDMHTPQLLFDCGRHLNCMATHASFAGSAFYLRCSKLLLAGIARKLYGPELLSNPNVVWVEQHQSYPVDALVLTDDQAHWGYGGALALMIGRDVIDDTPVMPYPMHHRSIQSLSSLDFSAHQQNTRRCGVLFAGRIKNSYKDSRIESAFGVTNRVGLISALRDARGDQIGSAVDFADRSDQGGVPIVLLDSSTQSIKPNDWLRTLSEFDFFLCCPGASQPMCHNAIEAMSAGTIPLIQYGDRFTPHLQDGVNAICFSGKDGLINAIERIESMASDQIQRLRAGVIEYFETHLRGDRFMAKLRDGELDTSRGMVSLPFHSENYFAPDAMGEASPSQSLVSSVA